MELKDITGGNFNIDVYNYSHVFDFEEEFYQNVDENRKWMYDNWTIAPISAAVYVIAVFVGQSYMSTRKRFELRGPLAIWSAVLAVFSIFGAIRTLPEFVYMLQNFGFEQSVCNASYMRGRTAVWAYLFTVSKLYELGDTAFIILRKQKLILLHWYHHAIVLTNAWESYSYHPSIARWFIVLNYSVHSVMYTYYTLRAMKIKVPKFVNIIITTLQIIQMILAIVVISYAYYVLGQGRQCQEQQKHLIGIFAMYASFFVLFSWFFYSTYIRKTSTKAATNGTHTNGINVANGHSKSVTNGFHHDSKKAN